MILDQHSTLELKSIAMSAYQSQFGYESTIPNKSEDKCGFENIEYLNIPDILQEKNGYSSTEDIQSNSSSSRSSSSIFITSGQGTVQFMV